MNRASLFADITQRYLSARLNAIAVFFRHPEIAKKSQFNSISAAFSFLTLGHFGLDAAMSPSILIYINDL